MTTWTQSQRVGLRPTRVEVWALRVAQAVEGRVEDRMRRRAVRAGLGSTRAEALEARRAAAASAWRGLRL